MTTPPFTISAEAINSIAEISALHENCRVDRAHGQQQERLLGCQIPL